MNAIGAEPNDWDKHFRLMADIDLSGYTGTSFNVIGTPESGQRHGRLPGEPFDYVAPKPFTGVFDGCGHAISNFTYTCEDKSYVGLFAYIEDPNAEIRDLGLVAARVAAESGRYVGSLVGYIGYGTVVNCYASGGFVTGGTYVGGLIGCDERGVAGELGSTRGCYATATVVGDSRVGGLVGFIDEKIVDCYAMGVVMGRSYVGGLVGSNGGRIANCYAAGIVLGDQYVGGLVGEGRWHEVSDSFWDVQVSQQATSANGEGKTTAQMQRAFTFRAWGEGDSAGVWTIDEGKDYPRLAWENRGGTVIASLTFSDLLAGAGTGEDPYQIHTVDELAFVASEPDEWGGHFILMADIDLMAYPGLNFKGPYAFTGVFDGNGHRITNLTDVREQRGTGLFESVHRPSAEPTSAGGAGDPERGVIKNLGLVNPIIDGCKAYHTGALVDYLNGGTVRNCCVEGGLVFGGDLETGGLVGSSNGTVQGCYVVGGTVMDSWGAGGLIGGNTGDVSDCYSTAIVIGEESVGGLVGTNWEGRVTGCFWDVEASGQAGSDGGTGLTTVEMMAASTFLEAGWDFLGEVENGVEDIWWILEGEGHPRLWWERGDESPL
jgi:hypothetical protein